MSDIRSTYHKRPRLEIVDQVGGWLFGYVIFAARPEFHIELHDNVGTRCCLAFHDGLTFEHLGHNPQRRVAVQLDSIVQVCTSARRQDEHALARRASGQGRLKS